MTIDYERLLGLQIPEREQSYTHKDTILYALGVGCGYDPVDEGQLRFVYEKDLHALPTMAVVLAHPGFWARDLDTGIDWVRIVHGEQGVELNKPLPPAATVIGVSRVVDIIDKGAGRGALVLSERRLYEKSTGDHLGTVTQSMFCRGDGGFGGPARSQPPVYSMPDRPADHVCALDSSLRAALIYRLSGDMNPLHVDPAVSERAGFPRPILQGLASFGMAGHAILRTVCSYDPRPIRTMQARFSAPAFPGDRLETEIWRDGDILSFQVRCAARNALVISGGRMELHA